MKNINNIYSIGPSLLGRVWLFLLLLVSLTSFAQTQPKIVSSIDSTNIKIGEQIHFKVEVEADTTAQVVFPEGQTFAPLEMVEALPVDTIIIKDKLNLIKKYALTQFDSGTYTLPRQQILINNKPYFTDSLKIEVNTVVVDTLQQKMYDIKSIIEVEKNHDGWLKYVLYVLAGLAIIGGLLYWFVFRKKPLTEEEKVALLPPYDRALLELKKLDESKYLIQSEHKEYYSQLTNIVRSYLEEDVHITALESTTDELINKLEMLKDAGNLKIGEDTIKQFKNVLQTADLVKFAKSVPDNSIIQTDRKTIEQIVVKTKEALPEPTEEELQHNEEYIEGLARKKRKKKIIVTTISAIFLLLVSFVAASSYFGLNYVKDSVFGHPTKELLESEWIASEYGAPPIYIETPKVLKRAEMPLPKDAATVVKSNQAFVYGSIMGHFYILTTITTYGEGVKIDLQKAIDGAIATMEMNGAKNTIVKQEDYKTLTGKDGVKVFGTFEINDPITKKEHKAAYTLMNFVQNGGFQQVIIVHKENDTYAEQIVQRIINSIDFKAAS